MESTQRWLRHSGVTEVLLQSLAEGTHGSDTRRVLGLTSAALRPATPSGEDVPEVSCSLEQYSQVTVHLCRISQVPPGNTFCIFINMRKMHEWCKRELASTFVCLHLRSREGWQ